MGKLADLLILNGNWHEKIRAAADAQLVMMGGTLYDATLLDQLWRRTVPFGPTSRVNDDMLQNNTKRADVCDRDERPEFSGIGQRAGYQRCIPHAGAIAEFALPAIVH